MRQVYQNHMDKVHDSLSNDEPLHLNGDGRFDSPGHCALFGTYTLMESKTGLIVASETIKVSNSI